MTSLAPVGLASMKTPTASAMIPWMPTVHQLCHTFRGAVCRAPSFALSCISGIPFPVPGVMATKHAGSRHYRRAPTWLGPEASMQRFLAFARGGSIHESSRRESPALRS
jgi:hypothetical protein